MQTLLLLPAPPPSSPWHSPSWRIASRSAFSRVSKPSLYRTSFSSPGSRGLNRSVFTESSQAWHSPLSSFHPPSPTPSPSSCSRQSRRHRRRISRTKIEHTISMALRYSLYMGILCVGLFTRFGPALGETFTTTRRCRTFHPDFILALPVSLPLHYHGKYFKRTWENGTVFVHHTVSMLLTLSLVLFAIPRWGIFAYLAALLISELVLAFSPHPCPRPRSPHPSASQPGHCKTGILPAGFDWDVRSYSKRVLPASPVSACPHQSGILCLLYIGGLLLLYTGTVKQ